MNKNKHFYAIKDYAFEGNTLIKKGMEVKVAYDSGSSFMFEGDSEGYLSYTLFRSIFSPFKLNEMVFHDFYGIGQIVLSHKRETTLAVMFFSRPNHFYDIDEVNIKMADLKR